jgi:23S rRNA-/tRNA-specific pseudouridylate synthase
MHTQPAAAAAIDGPNRKKQKELCFEKGAGFAAQPNEICAKPITGHTHQIKSWINKVGLPSLGRRTTHNAHQQQRVH